MLIESRVFFFFFAVPRCIRRFLARLLSSRRPVREKGSNLARRTERQKKKNSHDSINIVF